MADVDKTKGADCYDTLEKAAAKGLVQGVTDEDVVRFYNDWAAKGYDKSLGEATTKEEYTAPTVMQRTVADLFPAHRDTAVILDVGAGTGITGQLLLDLGFKIVDGLDPAAEMLRVAQEKKIYRNTYTHYLTGQPSVIPADSYDCVTMAGVVGHGCLPSAAFEEMTRITKPGGYIVNCMRRAYLTEVDDYRQNWEPLKNRMESEGRWRVVRMDPYPNHFIGKEGLLMVIQVLS